MSARHSASHSVSRTTIEGWPTWVEQALRPAIKKVFPELEIWASVGLSEPPLRSSSLKKGHRYEHAQSNGSAISYATHQGLGLAASVRGEAARNIGLDFEPLNRHLRDEEKFWEKISKNSNDGAWHANLQEHLPVYRERVLAAWCMKEAFFKADQNNHGKVISRYPLPELGPLKLDNALMCCLAKKVGSQETEGFRCALFWEPEKWLIALAAS